jgi:hypothetical protein
LLIVNHALLLSDVAAGGKVLPEYSYLIVDEGHHLESATTGAMSFRVTQFDLERMLKDIGGSSSGILGTLSIAVVHGPAEFGILQQRISAADMAFAGTTGRVFHRLSDSWPANEQDAQLLRGGADRSGYPDHAGLGRRGIAGTPQPSARLCLRHFRDHQLLHHARRGQTPEDAISDRALGSPCWPTTDRSDQQTVAGSGLLG